MKRLLKITAAITAVALISGCIPHTELNEKAIVLAVGIDYENEEYSVTFQYYSPTGIGGQTPVDNSQPNVITSSGKGVNVYEAMEDAAFKCGRELMSGVTQIIIIGEDAAAHSVDRVTDFAQSSFQSRPDMFIAVSEGKAEELMNVKFKEGIVSTQKLEMLLQNAQKNGLTILPSALDFFIALETNRQSICLPVLKLIDDGKSDFSQDGKAIEIDGGMLIMQGQAVEKVAPEVTEGLQLLWGKTEEYSVTVDRGDKKITLRLSDIRVKITPCVEAGRQVFDVKLSCEGRYLIAPPTSNDNEQMKKQCAEKLMEQMENAVSETVLKYGADPINLEKTVRHYDCGRWSEVKDSWGEVLKNSAFRFDVRVNIDKLSMED